MALPRKLKDFNLFGNGEDWQGQISEITLPKLSRKMEEFSPNGSDGVVEIDFGQEKIELEWTAAGLLESAMDGYAGTIDGTQLRFVGAYERDDTGDVDAVDIVIRGRHREIDMGTAKKGDNNEIKLVTSCAYYKLSINGKTIYEIDILGRKFFKNGKDILANRRAALGI